MLEPNEEGATLFEWLSAPVGLDGLPSAALVGALRDGLPRGRIVDSRTDGGAFGGVEHVEEIRAAHARVLNLLADTGMSPAQVRSTREWLDGLGDLDPRRHRHLKAPRGTLGGWNGTTTCGRPAGSSCRRAP